MADPVRCEWAVRHPELIEYHDEVWGRPTHDDRAIFAAYGQCILHAGLLWTAMLKKRLAFARAFAGWDIARVAAYDGTDLERLMEADGVIHNRQKLSAVIWDAGRILEVQREGGSFAEYLWRFTAGVALNGHIDEARARVAADQLSADLRRRKFKFAGSATAYGLMEDMGMVNDHDRGCFRAIEAGNA